MKFLILSIFTLATIFMPSTRANEEPQSISVSLQNFSRPIKCSIEKFPMYLCSNNNKPILIKYGKYATSALGKDKNNHSTFFQVLNVKDGNNEIFKTSINRNPKALPTLTQDYMDKVASIKYFFSAGEENNIENRLRGSELYEQLTKEHLSQQETIKNSYEKILNEKNYTVELNDGKKLNCKRGETKKLTEKQKNDYIDSDYGNSCGSFQCEPLTIKGKKYSPTLIYGSSAYSTFPATLHLLNNKEIGPQISVKKIYSNNSNLPLHDYSAYIDAMKEIDHQEEIERMPSALKDDREKVLFYKDFDLTLPMDHYKKFCKEDQDGGLANVFQAREKLLQKLADIKLVEFLQILDGKLMNELVEPSNAVKGGCFHEGVFLSPEAFAQMDKIKKNFNPDKNVDKTISMERAVELFNKARAMTDIPWGYRDDGCVYRAHLMAKRFESEGVRVDKVWLRGSLFVPGTDIKWDMHVAPIVYVKEKDEIKKMVIDPSLFDHPVTVDEWDNKIAKTTVGKSSTTVFPFPGNSPVMERSSIAFSSSDAFIPGDPTNDDELSKIITTINEMQRLLQSTELK